TKRPENMVRLFGEAGWTGPWPTNVWAGTTVENKKATERIEHLFGIPAALRWLSCEPLLEELDLTPWIVPPYPQHEGEAEAWEARYGNAPCGLDWVIVGGESGPGARPCDLGWARSIRDQCAEGKVPFFAKQRGTVWAGEHKSKTNKGEDPAEWPDDLRVHEEPRAQRPKQSNTEETTLPRQETCGKVWIWCRRSTREAQEPRSQRKASPLGKWSHDHQPRIRSDSCARRSSPSASAWLRL